MPTPIALRLLNQHLAAPQHTTPEEVVKYMCAMQAQEYRMMRWAVAMRTRRPSHKAFKKAFDSGKIVRLTSGVGEVQGVFGGMKVRGNYIPN